MSRAGPVSRAGVSLPGSRHVCQTQQKSTSRLHDNRARGPFLKRPGNLPGPESDFDIKVSRKVGCVLTFDEVHFVSLADNFTVQLSNFLKLPLEWKTKQLNGTGNYRELRETGPSPVSRDPGIAVPGSRLAGLTFFHVIAFAGPAPGQPVSLRKREFSG